jgi:hypothetical protein
MSRGEPTVKLLVSAKREAQGLGDDVLLAAFQKLGVVFQQGGDLFRHLARDGHSHWRFDLARDERHRQRSFLVGVAFGIGGYPEQAWPRITFQNGTH